MRWECQECGHKCVESELDPVPIEGSDESRNGCPNCAGEVVEIGEPAPARPLLDMGELAEFWNQRIDARLEGFFGTAGELIPEPERPLVRHGVGLGLAMKTELALEIAGHTGADMNAIGKHSTALERSISEMVERSSADLFLRSMGFEAERMYLCRKCGKRWQAGDCVIKPGAEGEGPIEQDLSCGDDSCGGEVLEVGDCATCGGLGKLIEGEPGAQYEVGCPDCPPAPPRPTTFGPAELSACLAKVEAMTPKRPAVDVLLMTDHQRRVLEHHLPKFPTRPTDSTRLEPFDTIAGIRFETFPTFRELFERAGELIEKGAKIAVLDPTENMEELTAEMNKDEGGTA